METSISMVDEEDPDAIDVVLQPDEDAPAEEGVDCMGDVLRRSMACYLDVVQELHAAGIESVGFKLPRIAVVGEQSAGKAARSTFVIHATRRV